MKVTLHEQETGEKRVYTSIADMPVRSIGQSLSSTRHDCPGGLIFIRTYTSATCLNDFGRSWSDNAHLITDVYVRILRKGAVLTLEVDDKDSVDTNDFMIDLREKIENGQRTEKESDNERL